MVWQYFAARLGADGVFLMRVLQEPLFCFSLSLLDFGEKGKESL